MFFLFTLVLPASLFPLSGSTASLSPIFQVFRFCTSKCKRNFNLKRNPRKVRWTKAYRRTNLKDMVTDSTFEFERVRNRPVRYDRDLYAQTVAAVKRVSEIRAARERRHHQARLREAAMRHLATSKRAARSVTAMDDLIAVFSGSAQLESRDLSMDRLPADLRNETVVDRKRRLKEHRRAGVEKKTATSLAVMSSRRAAREKARETILASRAARAAAAGDQKME
jgi:hypothetical protein